MKLFCSYAYTGEDVALVTARMQKVVEVLKEQGHDVYCPLFDEQVAPLQEANDIKAIFDHAFEGIRRQDAVVVVISSERRSEGQLMEVGAALSAKKPVYLLQNKSAVNASYLSKLVSATYVWENEDELLAGLKSLLN